MPTVQSRSIALVRCTVTTGALFVSAGCSSSNARDSIGDPRVSSAASQPVTVSAFTAAPAETLPPIQGDGPSLTGMSRAHWEPIAVAVPVDGTNHRYTYARERILTDQTARQRGRFPTPLSALDQTGRTDTLQLKEAGLAPLSAGLDAVLLLPRMAWGSPPWREVHGVPSPYERAAPDVRSFAEVPETDDAAARAAVAPNMAGVELPKGTPAAPRMDPNLDPAAASTGLPK